MPKGWWIVSVVLMAAVEPVIADGDLVRYAITQGGLLAVVLVLLWSYRKDSLGALRLERERVIVLTDLVGSMRENLMRSADTVTAQTKSIDKLTTVIERIDQRRYGRT